MAARTRRIAMDDNTRAKIQATQLIKRLTLYALGKLKTPKGKDGKEGKLIELSSGQVRAIEILLKKILPDLQCIEQTLEITERKVVTAEAMSIDEWESKAQEEDKLQDKHH